MAKGTITETPMLGRSVSSEFPTIDPRVSGRRYSRLVMLTRESSDKAAHTMLNSVSSFNLAREQLDTFRYPDGVIPEEHLYVPRNDLAPEQGGWVIGSGINYGREQMELRIFDADHLSDGPLATAVLPYALPMGLHAKFV